MRPYILSEANYAYTKANPYEVAVLPLGATEPHNLHLPYGTDTNMHKLPLAINVDPMTLFSFVTDIVRSCINSGVKKIVLLNSHGGNEMKPLLRELADKIDGHLFLFNCYLVLQDVYGELFEHKDDHGGEMETSFILASHPH